MSADVAPLVLARINKTLSQYTPAKLFAAFAGLTGDPVMNEAVDRLMEFPAAVRDDVVVAAALRYGKRDDIRATAPFVLEILAEMDSEERNTALLIDLANVVEAASQHKAAARPTLRAIDGQGGDA